MIRLIRESRAFCLEIECLDTPGGPRKSLKAWPAQSGLRSWFNAQIFALEVFFHIQLNINPQRSYVFMVRFSSLPPLPCPFSLRRILSSALLISSGLFRSTSLPVICMFNAPYALYTPPKRGNGCYLATFRYIVMIHAAVKGIADSMNIPAAVSLFPNRQIHAIIAATMDSNQIIVCLSIFVSM